MSADFWAGYLSGAVGIVIGNPLDILKVRLQAGAITGSPTEVSAKSNAHLSFLRGSAAPILGYGALNSLLFVTYNKTLRQLDPSITDVTKLSNVHLGTIWAAGAAGGVASWLVSAPSEVIKCRTQLAVDGSGSSLMVFKDIVRSKGITGLYYGGIVTSLRESIGYGFYFWSYELCHRWLARGNVGEQKASIDVLLAGGIAGVVTWTSIYPLDVVKTVLQTQPWRVNTRTGRGIQPELGSLAIARDIMKTGGFSAFYRGIGVCSVRAFIVNAVQWFTYEEVMKLLQ